MHNLKSSILLLFFGVCCQVWGRNIQIPDSAFKAFLVGTYDTNGDFEVSVAEAGAATGLLNCANLGISDLTGIEYFVNIEVLYCYGNNLTQLPRLCTLGALRELWCNNNQLTGIPVLCGLTNLEKLMCYNNQITELPAVSQLPNLTELDCKSNLLDSCDCPAIALIDDLGLSTFAFNPQQGGNLTCNGDSPICFGDTTLKDSLLLPYDLNFDGEISVSEAQNATGSLDLSNSGFIYLTGIEYFTRLLELNASGNLLTSLPDLSRLSQLETLRVADNDLTTLPELCFLTQLQELLCSYAGLTELPDLSALTRLELLIAEHNDLRQLPSLDQLDQLYWLICHHNQLSSLPEISHLQNLRWLACGWNPLTSLPEISGMQNLEELYCQHANLTTIPQPVDVPNLLEIICPFNQIQEIPTLNEAPSLYILDLSYNKLAQLPPDWNNLQQLGYIHLNHNRLTEVPDFSSLALLGTVNLHNNRLVSVPGVPPTIAALTIERNYLDEGDCEEIQEVASYGPAFLDYSPQGSFASLEPDLVLWPQPGLLLEWVAAISQASFEYDLVCGP